MESYQYKLLQGTEIRLITLEPKSSGDNTISIKAVTLSQDEIPSYEALSYEWGSTEHLEHIEVQGLSEGAERADARKKVPQRVHSRSTANVYSLAITRNLAQALPYLQHAEKPRTLWIDAICINQQDIFEKGQQVGRMGTIYKSAASVVVWLGLPTEQLSTGLKVMSHLASMVEVDFDPYLILPASGQDPSWADPEVELPYEDETRSAISAVLECAWFERLWIIQEIHARPENSMLLCGSTFLTWTEFRKAIYCLGKNVSLGADSGRGFDVKKLATVQTLCRTIQNFGLQTLLQFTEDAKCSDPKDRIYSLLALLRRNEQISLQPDYTVPFGEVYREATIAHIKAHGKLGMLEGCQLHDHPDSLPTWVRDWSRPGKRRMLLGRRASLYSKAEAIFHGGNVIELAGVEVITIETVDVISAIFSPHTLPPKDLIQELLKLIQNETLRNNHENDAMESLLRVLACNGFSNPHEPEAEDALNLEDLQVSLRQRKTQECSHYEVADRAASSESPQDIREPTRSEREFRQFSNGYTRGRALIKTCGGQIGLGPDDAQAGDRVCVLLGCNSPLILRPVPAGSWQVVGSCYIHELRYGAALFGPLPEHFRAVQQLRSGGGYSHSYLDKRSGKETPHDPRAGPLPPGWELGMHDMQDFDVWYRNIETDEKTHHDPRLTSKALRERGVPMRTFKLI